MSASTTSFDELISREYQHGFVTDLAADALPSGLSEDVIRMISAKKNEPAFMLEWRLKAFRHWLTMTEPHWATVRHPPIDYQGIVYYSAPKSTTGPTSLKDVDPELLRTYDKARCAAARSASWLAGVAVDAVFDSVSVATTFSEKLSETRHRLLFVFRSGAEAPRPRAALPGLSRALHRQLFRDAQLRRVQRRLVLLHPARRALPDGAVDVLPHQCEEYRPVRAHADHRRQGRLRELSGRLHRTDARRESAPRGGGRADRAGRRADPYSTVQNWYPGDASAGAASTTS